MPVAIVGAARSGTSLVTRLLGLSGVYLGPEEDLYGATRDNPTGHWEHLKLQDISLRLLSHLGGCYDAPPLLDAGWELDSSLDLFYEEARQAVALSFQAHGLWGWKDPQVSFLIPFWKRAVPGLRFVVCVRNPLEVASSWTREKSETVKPLVIAHWHVSNLIILAETMPSERIFAYYDNFFPDFHVGLDPILSFLGIPGIFDGSEAHSEITRYINRGLKHHNSTVEDVLSAQSIPPMTRRFYSDLASGGGKEIDRQLSLIAEILSFQLPKCELMHQLFDLESRNLELHQILDSTTHRAASALCSLLIKADFARAVAPLKRLRKRQDS